MRIQNSNYVLVPMQVGHLLNIRRLVIEVTTDLDRAREALPILNAMTQSEIYELRKALVDLG